MAGFPALVLTEAGGKVAAEIRQLADDDLPPGAVTVAIAHSTLNYKDGLILGGLGRLVRRYPHVPGIDFAGTVEASASPQWKPGDKVVLTGWRVGELHWGGYAGKARVKAEWLVPLPDALTTRQAMAIGTAGFTAMLAIDALEGHGLKPGNGEVLVTGAAGGVGSVAVAALAALGYTVTASTGRAETHAYLRDLGATTIIDRQELAAPPAKPLLSERWAGCVETVGGTTLAGVLPALKYGASLAACGNAGGLDFAATVLPFILRGVNLLGIESVMQPMPARLAAWSRLARVLPLGKLDAMTQTVPLADLPRLGREILAGRIRGRVVVEVNA